MRLKKMILMLLFAFPVLGKAQETSDIMEYIDTYKALAMSEMKRTGVPASIKLAQGIHETMAGTSPLVMKSNNHFGIKCKTGWAGPSVKHDDDARNECFRKYASPEDSYRDHSDFLRGSQRYAGLFNLDPTDFEAWAWGLKKSGYATNPKYAQTLIKLIEDYGLQQYSLIALGRQKPIPETEETITEDAPEAEPATQGQVADKMPPAGPTAADSVTAEKAMHASESAAHDPVPARAEAASSLVGKPNDKKPAARYPSGIFRQNGLRAIFVEAGTPYLAIANQCKISLSRLFEYNDMTPSVQANSDQLLYLERQTKRPIHLPLRNKKAR